MSQALVLGTHVHDIGAGAAWPPSGFTALRLWDARVAWRDLQPAAGEWRFDRLDRIVAEAAGQGRHLLLPLGLSPRWASSRPDEASAYGAGHAAPPRSMADWTTYVGTTVRRYKGRIQAYEVWNEPNKARFFSGTVDDAVRLTCEVRRILTEIDPQALLVSPAPTGQQEGVEWLGRFLAAGGGRCIDVVGFHFYTLAHEPPEAVLPLISAVRREMGRQGLDAKPVWDTEFGWFIANARQPVETRYRVLPPGTAGAYLARAWLLRAASGIEHAYFYAWNNRNMGLVEPDSGEPKPSATVLPRVQAWTQAPWVLGVCTEAAGLWRCPVTSGGREAGVVAWAAESGAEGALIRLVAQGQAQGARVEWANGDGGGAAVPGLPVRILWR